jgi:hypothetical protein
MQNYDAKTAVYLPAQTLELVKREFHLTEDNVDKFLLSVIERTVQEHAIERESSSVFAKDEIKELEDDLKGLGYI